MNKITDKRIFLTRLSGGAITTPLPTVYTGITNDTTIVVPGGYMLECIMFLNSTANVATISCGTTAGGTEVFINATINGSGTYYGITNQTINNTFNLSSNTTLYIHDNAPGDSWNSANVSIYLILRKLV